MCERHKHWMDWSEKVVFGLLLQGRVDEMDAIVTASVSGCNLQETNFFSSLWFVTITITIFSAFMVFLLSLCLKFSRCRRCPISKGQKKKVPSCSHCGGVFSLSWKVFPSRQLRFWIFLVVHLFPTLLPHARMQTLGRAWSRRIAKWSDLSSWDAPAYISVSKI